MFLASFFPNYMFTVFRNLTENAQRLLCIYAYSGMGSQKSLREYKNMLHNEFEDFSTTSDAPELELEKAGMFIKKGFSWYTNQTTYVIPDSFFVPALWFTLKERIDLADVFKQMRLSSGVQFQYVRNSVYQLISSNYTACSYALYLKVEDVRYFESVCMREEFRALFTNMAKDVFDVFFTRTVFNFIENDIVVDSKYLESLLNGYKASTLPTTLKLKSYIELYNYIANGILPTHEIKSTDFAGLTLAAIHRVLEGKYADAVKVFQMALKIQNKSTDMKNMYMNSLLNHYLIVAYSYDNTADSKTKLKQFLNKTNIEGYYTLVPSRIVAEQTLSSNKDWHKEGINNLLVRGFVGTVPKTVSSLAYLIDKYYDLGQANELVGFEAPKPNMMILKHELADFIDLSDEERALLKTHYGERAGLNAVRHKAAWEVSLERLLNFGKEKTAESQAEEQNFRLMYLFHSYRGGVEVREQSRLKNGQWGSGKPVTMNKFVLKQVEGMTEADERILARYRNSDSYELQIEHVIEEMTEVSRLYTGNFAPYTLINVKEEKPYLIVEKSDSGFLVRSNIPKNKYNEPIIIIPHNEENISFIKLPDTQRMIFRELLSVGKFPFAAEEGLRAALAHVGAKVEIHSELIEGGSTLQTVEGVARACIRIKPDTHGIYTVTISSHPLPGGREDLTLAKGEIKFVDELDGQRVWVQRDMEGEKRIAQLFVDFINEQEDNPDVDFYEPDVMLDSESRLQFDPVDMLTLLEFVQNHPAEMYAEWPEGKKSRIRSIKKGESAWTGTLHEKGMWFQLEGDIQIDDDTVLSMSQLLDLISTSKGKYVQLGDGEFLALSETLQRQLRALEAVATREKGQINISPFSAALLADDVVDGDIHLFMSKNLLELRKKILDSANYTPEVPAELNATLRPYQIDGYQWMARLNSWGAGALLADDMGLGKTVQTIAFLLLKAKEGASLVVAPASVAPNWKTEFQKFAPSLNTIILNFAENREQIIKDAGPNDVIITTYGILLSEHESINARSWNVACLDEAHIIKNRGAKTSAVAMKIQADNRVILTGTPVQNHLSELWSLFQFINPGLLGGYEAFSRRFISPIERDQNKECQKRLDKIVHPFMLRRTKSAVLQELPEKTEIYQKVELSKEEMAVYEVIRKKAETLLQSQSLDEKIDFNVLAEITHLRQASCSARLVEKSWTGECSKVTAFYELLEGVIEGDNRALVFSQFVSFFDIIREKLDKEGIPYLYIDGSVPVKKRTELVEKFQKGECPVFLISLKAGGLGLNLTNANYVIHLDPWWNPAIEQQATDRAYRIGQKQAVTVYHLIAENTIEEKIIRLHQTKRDLADNILAGTDVSHKLTGKDLLEMVAK